MTGASSLPPARRAARSHIPELDGVRGLAIAGVMALHFVNNQVTPTNTLERAAVTLSNYGLWGVDLFFVLSGFLITGILADARGRDGYFSSFFIRRALRIFPLYYGVLLVMTVLVPPAVLGALDHELLDVRALWPWLWTYLTNVYLAPETTFSIPYVSHFWSLAIEEHFYLVWPFVIWSLSTSRAMQVSAGLGLLALSLRLYFGVTAPAQLYADVLTPCRVDALCAGAWFALAARQQGGLPRDLTLRIAGVAAALVVALSFWHIVSHAAEVAVLALRTTALAVFFGALIHAMTHHPGLEGLKAAMRAGWLRHLGRYSYGLYVFHGIVAYAMHRAAVPAWFAGLTGLHTLDALLMVTAGVSVSYALALASYHGFEQPFLTLKDRFTPSASPPAV